MSSMVTYNRPWNRTATSTRETAIEQSAILRSMRRHPVAAGRTTTPTPAPRPQVTTTPAPRLGYAEVDALLLQVPVGRYALPKVNPTPDNDITFFEIVANKRTGKHLVRMLVGSVGDFEHRPMPLNHQFFAAKHILEDVASAASLYGKKAKACGFCAANGRFSPLTHKRSRAAGYGKDCAEKHGLPW